MMRAAMVMAMLAAGPADRIKVSTVECKTVDDCWLDDGGHAVKRPEKMKGHELPRGDCGRNLIWLRNKLRCEVPEGGKAKVCVAENVGDKC